MFIAQDKLVNFSGSLSANQWSPGPPAPNAGQKSHLQVRPLRLQEDQELPGVIDTFFLTHSQFLRGITGSYYSATSGWERPSLSQNWQKLRRKSKLQVTSGKKGMVHSRKQRKHKGTSQAQKVPLQVWWLGEPMGGSIKLVWLLQQPWCVFPETVTRQTCPNSHTTMHDCCEEPSVR